MDKTVLNQRFQYHEITPYRDYSKLSEKPQKTKILSAPEDPDDLFGRWVGEPQPRMAYVHLEVKNQRTRKNTKYYYSSTPDGERIGLQPYRAKSEQFYTTKDSSLIRHYGRPFSQVATNIHERTIKMDDDVLSVRINYYSKSRHVNCKYFKKHSHSRGFSFNLKTGNIVMYEGAKGTMKIRQNSFEFLLNILNGIFKTHNCCISPYLHTDKNINHPINLEYNNIFDDDEFRKTLYHAVSSKLPENSLTKYKYGGEKYTTGLQFVYHGLIEIFVNIKGIKVPNDFIHLMRGWYPTKQFLKKNDNKLIAAILDRLGLKTKSLIKLLHKNPRFEIAKLTLLGKYFGYNNIHKYIHNISPKFFDDWSTRSESGYLGVDTMYSLLNNKFEYDIKDSERTVLLKLINSFFDTIESVELRLDPDKLHSTIRNQFGQITDHLDLIVKIRQHLPDMEMRCQSIRDFHTEHLEFSKIDRSIKKGYSIEYKFDPKLIEHVEEPIYSKINIGSKEAPVYTYDMDSDPAYYPVILKIDAEYTEEGKHMHHCVGSYADKEMSVIVSLREGSVNGSERVTCEFDPRDKSCVQAKYFCNAIPPERFEYAIEKIKHRIKIYKGSIKSLSKEKIPLIINGVQLELSNPHDDFLEMLNLNRPEF